MIPPARQLVVGTAGHIDHGKSRLVRALTGTDPDRLPEEKARGMTIDLGFAHTRIGDADIWFVDVPGHERFIRNMVAGATGVDAAMLVVAADDSVMPQTREHAEVLSLLGVRHCIVVLSKVDLVDDDWAAQVQEEAHDLLLSFGIEPSATVWTSAENGRGLDALRRTLAGIARDPDADADQPTWFRMPIDRAFTIAGRGTVVTGSVTHGSVRAGDELELLPAQRRVRVRDIQSHFTDQPQAVGRMRLALNLAGTRVDEVQRGDELATAGYLEPAQRIDVLLPWLRMPGKTVRQTLRLKLHVGTRDVRATLRLLEPPAGRAIHDALGQLRLAHPVVTAWGQRFILRDEGGERTLGGGVVLHPAARTWTTRQPANSAGLRRMAAGTVEERVEEAVWRWAWEDGGAARLAARAGLRDEPHAAALLDKLRGLQRLHVFETGASAAHVHTELLRSAAEAIVARLARTLAGNPRSPGIPLREWPGWMPRTCPERLRPAVAEWLVRRGHVVAVEGLVLPKGHQAAISEADQQLLRAVLAEISGGRFQPPLLSGLKCRDARNARRLGELVRLAESRGDLVRIGDEMFVSGDVWRSGVKLVTETIRARGPLTVAEIRTLLASSRKYVVPLVEALDAAGVTRRQGDVRHLGPRAAAASREAPVNGPESG